MYLRGNRWSPGRRSKPRPNPLMFPLLLAAIGALVYVSFVVVPEVPPLFIPTPTPTRSPESFINQAEQYAADGKFIQAIEAYKEAILADPENPALFVTLARIQIFAGKYADAVVNTQNALLQNPNNPTAYAIQGWARSYLGETLEAEAAVKRALDLEPNSALAHAIYAEILINRNDPEDLDKAIEESKLAQQLDPNLLETRRARGLVLLNTQNLEEAAQELKAAIAINDKIADLHLNLGVVYRAMNQNDLAVESLLAAYSLNPEDSIALTEISRAYGSEGQFGKASQYAAQAVKVEPTNPRLRGNLGVMYYRNQELDKAIPELALAVRGGTAEDGAVVQGLPLDYGRVAEYYWFYGFALAKSRRCGEAIPVFQALLVGVPDYALAVENAQAGLELCAESLGTPMPTETPAETPTP